MVKCGQIYSQHTIVERKDCVITVPWNTLWLIDWFMMFNATFNDISIISWWSFLLVEETGVPGENHQPVASH